MPQHHPYMVMYKPRGNLCRISSLHLSSSAYIAWISTSVDSGHLHCMLGCAFASMFVDIVLHNVSFKHSSAIVALAPVWIVQRLCFLFCFRVLFVRSSSGICEDHLLFNLHLWCLRFFMDVFSLFSLGYTMLSYVFAHSHPLITCKL